MKGLALAALLAAAGPAAALPPQDGSKYYYEDILEPFFKKDPADPSRVVSARDGANPSSFEAVKPAGVFRAFIIGGSTAGGFSAAELARGLEAALPGRRVEAVNCGMSGYDSDREALVLAEVLGYQPDLIVSFSGHNDFLIKSSKPLPAWRVRSRRLLARLPGWDAWERYWRRAPSASPPPTEADRSRRLSGLLANVRGHVRSAARAGAAIVVCLPPMDYELTAPRAGFPWRDPDFLRGWLAFLRGRYGAASSGFEKALAGTALDRSGRAFAWHYLARAGKRLRRHPDSRRAFLASLEEASGDDLCPPSCLKAVAELAAGEGASVADLDAAFRAKALPGLPGKDFFVDEIHWAPGLDGLITGEILAALGRSPKAASLSWNGAAAAAWAKRPPAPSPDQEARHREAALFYTVQSIETGTAFSGRVIEGLEAAEGLRPGWTSSEAAFERAAEETYRSYNNSSPGLYRSRLENQAVSKDRLAGYYGAFRLEAGDCKAARGALARSLSLRPDGLSEFRLLKAAADALCGEPKAALDELQAAARAGRSREAGALKSALGL